MTHHAKAPSTRSSTRQGSRLGRIVRGVFATRAASRDAKGTGAPRVKLALAAVLVLATAAVLADTAPTPVISEPTEVAFTTAHLNGTVNPNGGPSTTSWHFQYSKDPGGEGWSDGPGGELTGAEAEESSPLPVAVDLAPGTLAPGTTYFVRLVASNDGGQNESSEEELTTKVVSSPTATIDAPSPISAVDGTYAFTGHVNPSGTDPAFETQWSFSCEPSCGSPAGGTIGPDESNHLVEAEVTGLEAKTTYTVTLHATNDGGEATAEATFKTPAGPPFVALEQTVIKPHGVIELHGNVNPRGSTLTDCHFAYGTTTAYGQSVACEADENGVHAALSNLIPGATYHFRLEAASVGGSAHTEDATFEALQAPSEESCPNEQVRVEQHSTLLPDCRAYEQVSPVDKNGSNVVAWSLRTQAATDGEGLLYSSLVGFGDAHGSGVSFDYLAHRGAPGWSTHGITPTVSANTAEIRGAGFDSAYLEASPDLSRGIFAAAKPLDGTPESVAGVGNLYLRDDLAISGAGNYQLLTACPLCEKPGEEHALEPLSANPNILTPYLPRIAGSSSDLRHVAFESIENLTEDAPAQTAFCGPVNEPPFPPPSPGSCAARLYEYSEDQTRLAGILPDGTAADFSVAGVGAKGLFYTPHVVSDGSDGHTRIEFTQPTDQAGLTFSELDPFGQILLALPVAAKSGNLYQRIDGTETIQLNKSERTEPSPFSPATYLDASVDGERVFFASGQALTDDAKPGNSHIYLYDVSKPAGHRLVLIGEELQALFGMSDDGRYAYLQAVGRGIVLWHDGTLRVIGNGPYQAQDLDNVDGSWSQSVHESRVTAGGRRFLLVTDIPPVRGEFDHGACTAGFGCHELYVYSADSNTWQCASCAPDGALPTHNVTVLGEGPAGGSLGTFRLDRALSADGRYVFFNTVDPLVSEDTNGTDDAYEYDTRTGEVSLLSSGTSKQGSWFLEADPEGENVFIGTAQPLVGYDNDSAYDVYDVRVNGGFPEPRPQPAPCAGDGCQGSQATPPAPAPVGSGLEGPGNRKPKPQCSKGKVRKGSKCVKKKHSSKRPHHKRSGSNRGGAK